MGNNSSKTTKKKWETASPFIPAIPKGQKMRESQILMIGLCSAGKRTILSQIHKLEPQRYSPTIGFYIHTINYNRNTQIHMWNVGGGEKLRDLWMHYYNGVKAIIFVIDSADKTRIWTASEELELLLNEDKLRDAMPFSVCK